MSKEVGAGGRFDIFLDSGEFPHHSPERFINVINFKSAVALPYARGAGGKGEQEHARRTITICFDRDL